MTEMIGNRKYPDDQGNLNLMPGEYGYQPVYQWWLCCTPNGHLGNLKSHDVTEHEDGSISVSPSILVSDGEKELWHGYLTSGIWREV